MTYAFVIVLLAGVASTAIFAAMWQGAAGALAAKNVLCAQLEKSVSDAQAQREADAQARDNEKVRLEAEVVALKAEIARLEADIGTCRSPDAVRARLRSLLGR